jgi:hypothetical protein
MAMKQKKRKTNIKERASGKVGSSTSQLNVTLFFGVRWVASIYQ